jgi:NADPH:quinone reductase
MKQIIKLLGGTVIGRVSNAAKVDAAQVAGADHVIVDSGNNFADEAIRLAGGEVPSQRHLCHRANDILGAGPCRR